jgi:hypothetical protein
MNVLYTSLLYKNKKVKSWSDGTLKSYPGKCELYDELGNIIDTTWKSLPQGESNFTMDKYLIDLQSAHEDAKSAQQSAPKSGQEHCRKRKYRPLTLSKKQISIIPTPEKISSPKTMHGKKLKTCFSSWKSDSEDCSDSLENIPEIQEIQGIQLDLQIKKESLDSLKDHKEFKDSQEVEAVNIHEEIHVISSKNTIDNVISSQGTGKSETEFDRIIFPNADQVNIHSKRSLSVPVKFRNIGINTF